MFFEFLSYTPLELYLSSAARPIEGIVEINGPLYKCVVRYDCNHD